MDNIKINKIVDSRAYFWYRELCGSGIQLGEYFFFVFFEFWPMVNYLFRKLSKHLKFKKQMDLFYYHKDNHFTASELRRVFIFKNKKIDFF